MRRFLIALLALALFGGGAACITGLPTSNGGGDSGDDDDSTSGSDTGDDDDATQLYEGDEPGECDDGADNDQDGLFDCDDPDCAGAPVCDEKGNDDDAGDDDDTAGDDDDTAGDDDDTAGDDDDTAGDDDDTSSAEVGQPVITSIIGTWDNSLARFDFQLFVQDSLCDLGQPTLHWALDGTLQAPISYTGTSLTCDADPLSVWIGSAFTAGSSYSFGFQVEDSIGQLSDVYNLVLTAN